MRPTQRTLWDADRVSLFRPTCLLYSYASKRRLESPVIQAETSNSLWGNNLLLQASCGCSSQPVAQSQGPPLQSRTSALSPGGAMSPLPCPHHVVSHYALFALQPSSFSECHVLHIEYKSRMESTLPAGFLSASNKPEYRFQLPSEASRQTSFQPS